MLRPRECRPEAPGMLAEERRNYIRRQLAGTGAIQAAETAGMLGVSAMTLWRDLGELERAGALRRVRGGAVAVAGGPGPEPHFATKIVRAAKAKRRIALHAVSHWVPAGATLALEGGTTVAAMMPLLPEDRKLTLLTNSLEIARQAPAGATVLCTGGLYREVAMTFVGPTALHMLGQHRSDVAFVSATGFDPTVGLMDPNPLEIEVKRALCRSATRIILLLDASKWRESSLAPALTLAEIDVVVTDAPPPPDIRRQLRQHNVAIEIAR